MKKLFAQLVKFGIVGVTATVVHYFVAMAAIGTGIVPAFANSIAFLVAFAVSFSGHSQWSFEDSKLPAATSLKRFMMVALGGFLMNQVLFLSLLKYTDQPASLILGFVLAVVAGLTFLASRIWAFREDKSPGEELGG